MKNLLTIIALMLLSFTAYAQDPTKQETIDWIAGKMEKYLNPQTESKDSRRFLKYEDSKFYYRMTAYDDDGAYMGYHIVCLHLDRITNYKSIINIINEKGEIEYKVTTGEIKGPKFTTYDYSNTSWSNKNEFPTFDSASILLGKWCKRGTCNTDRDFWDSKGEDVPPVVFNFDLEQGLIERVEKALLLLVKYNTNTENERF
jgi:hypothetical protein